MVGFAVATAFVATWFLTTGISADESSAPLAEQSDQIQAASLAGLFPRSPAFEYEPPLAGSYDLPVIKAAPEGRLLDHTGTSVDLKALLAGKQSLVAFVYLNCADAHGCPLAMATLWQIHDASKARPALREAVQLVTISFDPARDTPEALSNIVAVQQADQQIDQKISWRFLTGGSSEALAPLLKGFGQSIGPSADPGKINHLLRLFLVDRAGDIRNVYGLGSIDPRLIMTDVATLMLQETEEY